MIDNVIRQAYVRLMRILRVVFKPLGILIFLEKRRNKRLYLWLRSLFAIYDFEDLSGLDLPWWSFDAIDAVERFLSERQDARVFEYGSGASTVWLSHRAKEIHSVENDREWFSFVQNRLGGRRDLHLHFRPGRKATGREGEMLSGKRDFTGIDYSNFVQAIHEVGGQFDLIIIDGRARCACLDVAVDYLHPDGIIVFDDSKRSRYRPAIEGSGLEVWHARSLAACLPLPDQTSILARNETVLSNLKNTS